MNGLHNASWCKMEPNMLNQYTRKNYVIFYHKQKATKFSKTFKSQLFSIVYSTQTFLSKIKTSWKKQNQPLNILYTKILTYLVKR